MFSYFSLIITLAVTLSGDALFGVAIIWRVLASGGSAKTLAFFLCFVMLLTFILQKVTPRFKKYFENDPRRFFACIRAAGIILSIAFIPLLWHETTARLYFVGMIFSVISYLSILTVEAIMGQEVLQKRLTSNQAARILQTAMQLAAFLGASCAGFILGLAGMKSVLIVNAITYASGVFVYGLLVRTRKNAKVQLSSAPTQSKSFSHNQKILWISFLGLFFLTCQIAAFNFLMPQIAQIEKLWTATQFGLIDAAAGLGAFLCTFVILGRGFFSTLWIYSFLAIFLSDIAFHFFTQAFEVLPAAFMLGFFVNAFRIKQRECMYDSVSNTQELYEWTGRITVMTAFVKAFLPLMLAELMFMPSMSFVLCGGVIGFALMFCMCAYWMCGLTSREQELMT